MFIEQPPNWFRKLYPEAIWRIDTAEKEVYLTFDDGPIPEVTPWILSILEKYEIKATFFIVGDNAKRYPKLFEMIKQKGHRVGNHTFNHFGGLRHGKTSYLNNVEKANEILQTDLFRPPHGLIKWSQYKKLKRNYKIIMWDVVTRDYSSRLNGRDILFNIRKYVRPGSIITFHDSLKSEDKLYYALPKAIEWILSQGYQFKVFD